MALLILVCILISNVEIDHFANAEEIQISQTYSNVLDDLQKDESFSMDYYPQGDPNESENYYSLQLVQIAESVNNELFVYVYQPSGQAEDIRASYISLSTNPKEDIKPNIYELIYLNSAGTLYKYMVRDFEVSSANTRYYAVMELLRPRIAGIDKESGNDNIVNHVEFPVKRQYKFSIINEKLSIQVTEIETIDIIDKWVGFCRYPDGFKLYRSACDAHFVAFDTDKPIDKLISADVYCQTQSYSRYWYSGRKYEEFGEITPLSSIKVIGEKVSYTGDGWFAGTYEWARIQSVEDFITNESRNDVYEHGIFDQGINTQLNEETLKSNLQGKKWVLRFLETDYTFSPMASDSTYFTIVSNVSILRLEFWTNGNYYNLGVVDNMQSGDLDPDNDVSFTWGMNENNGLIKLLKIMLAVALLILLVVILSWIIKIILSMIDKFKGERY